MFLDNNALLIQQLLLKLLHHFDIVLGIAFGYFTLVYGLTVVVAFHRFTTLEFHAKLLNMLFELDFKHVLDFSNALFHAGVPVVLDGVVCAALKDVCDVSPLVGVIAVQQVENPLFFECPDCLPLYHGIEVVVPALTALFADSTWKVVCNSSPLLWAIDVDQVQQQSVFDISPGTFDKAGIQHFLPSVQALHISPSIQVLSNLLPVLAAIEPDSFGEFLILSLSPVAFDFDVGPIIVLLLLVLGRSSLVEMGIQLLVSDQVLLSFVHILEVQASVGIYLVLVLRRGRHLSVLHVGNLSHLSEPEFVLVCFEVIPAQLRLLFLINESLFSLSLARIHNGAAFIALSWTQSEIVWQYLYLLDLTHHHCLIIYFLFFAHLLFHFKLSFQVLSAVNGVHGCARSIDGLLGGAALVLLQLKLARLDELVVVSAEVDNKVRFIILTILLNTRSSFQVLSAASIELWRLVVVIRRNVVLIEGLHEFVSRSEN